MMINSFEGLNMNIGTSVPEMNPYEQLCYDLGYSKGKEDAVVHGEWIREDETQAILSVMWHCSNCEVPLEMNGILTPIGAGYKYCPNCGCHMNTEVGDEK